MGARRHQTRFVYLIYPRSSAPHELALRYIFVFICFLDRDIEDCDDDDGGDFSFEDDFEGR